MIKTSLAMRAVVGIASTIVMMTAVPPASAVVVEWPVASGGNGHYYEAVFFGVGIDWPEAKMEAELRGGHLATVNSSDEGDFIVTSVLTSNVFWQADTRGVGFNDLFGPWIGGFQGPGHAVPLDGWQWVTGENFAPTFWAVGEPNDIGDESFLHFYGKNGVMENRWNDYRNGNPLGGGDIKSFVVEFSSVPEAVGLAMWSLVSVVSAVGVGWRRWRFAAPRGE